MFLSTKTTRRNQICVKKSYPIYLEYYWGVCFFIWPKRNIYKKNIQFDFSSLRSISCINEYVFTLK